MRARAALPFLCLLVALGIGACDTPPRERFAELTFGHLGTIDLDVARIEVVEAYVPSAQPPHVELEFPVPPMVAARRWVSDRLRARSSGGTATVTILDASAIEEPLPVSGGITGMFRKDQAERYVVRVSMHIAAADAVGQRRAEARADAVRRRTVPEGITLTDRRRTWFEMTEVTMADFDRAFAEHMRANLGGFILPPPRR